MYLTWGPWTWALASGCPPLFSHLLVLSRNTDHWLSLVRGKLHLTHWFSLEIYVILIGTDRRAQVRPTNRSQEYNLRWTPGQDFYAVFNNKKMTTGHRLQWKNGGIYERSWGWSIDFTWHILRLVGLVPGFSSTHITSCRIGLWISSTHITSQW